MPNQNYFEAREELKMAQCDLSLSYPTCKAEERPCKFAYSSWCPTCDRDSPRRRSKSETNEPCRKKGREMKGMPRRHEWDQECENMELEYEVRDVRYDTYRIRSNLCELPTTYITNNCQMTKLSSCPSDFSDNTEKGLKCYENGLRSNDFCSQYQNFGDMVEKQDRISKLFPRIDETARNVNGVTKKVNSKSPYTSPIIPASAPCYLETKRSPKNPKYSVRNGDEKRAKPPNGTTCSIEVIHNHMLPKNSELLNFEARNRMYEDYLRDNQNRFSQGDYKQVSEVHQRRSPQPGFARSPQANCNLVDLKFFEVADSPAVHYDTCTFFDKRVDVSNLRERYAREVELLKEKLKCLKNNVYEDQPKAFSGPVKCSPPLKVENFGNAQADLKRIKQNQVNGAVPRIPPFARKEQEAPAVCNKRERISKSVSKVSLKTKGKLGPAKLKKQRAKVCSNNAPISSDVSDSDCSGSEDSDKEENDHDNLEIQKEQSVVSSIKEVSSNGSVKLLLSGIGDISNWPVRQSLFPYVPPYLCFSMHDAMGPQKFPAGARFLKWKMSTITPILVRKTLTNSGFRLVRKSNEWVGTWGKHMKSPMFKTLKDTQKLNHFPGTFQIGRKDRLWRNLQRLMLKHGQKEFGFTPQTYVLPQDLKLLKQHWQNKNGSGNEKYIIKPPASARGTGIKVINRWSQLPKRTSLVVQEYISNPYLINGSKFDLRLYVLVTSFNPLRIYLYPDGLARFASVPYSDDAKDLKDRYMHLTNYSINKMSSQYTANEDANACKGHKWTLSKLWEYMEKKGVDTKALWKNLQQLVIKTLISGESSIVPLCRENMMSRYNCYELFGVDVLLDEHLKSWLLEVNISPSLHSQSPLDEHVKGPMVKSLFELAQFHLPPRLSKAETKAVPHCYDSRIYAITLTKKERNKHNYFCQTATRQEYLDIILEDLTGDDVRQLLQAEDELVVIGKFERIFPTAHTYKYLEFLDVRYYNRLFDAWESKYEKNRQPGIKVLQSLCDQKVHLKVAPAPVISKSLPSMSPGDPNLQPLKEDDTHPMPMLPPLPLAAPSPPPLPLVESTGPAVALPTKLPSVDLRSLYNALRLQSEKRSAVLRPPPCTDFSTHV